MTSRPSTVIIEATSPGGSGSFDVETLLEREGSSVPAENIKVVVRSRPLSKKELDRKCKVIVDMDTSTNTITVAPPDKMASDHQTKTFSFDHVFPNHATQADVYNAVARPIVQNVLEGYNGTIFAYGQTGTGKTFTMKGLNDVPELKGIIPNSFAQIFASISKAAEGQRFLVRCSYLEIYNENIRDLLSKDQTQYLELKENKVREVYVKDLTSLVVRDADDMDRVMSIGNKNRSVASTNMNSVSSRSHAIFNIVVECSTTDSGPTKGSLRMGKLNLVDLAGSERLSKTHATGDRLKEATNINLSLSNLGNVISALVDGSSYIPYRNSKLTRLLQDSLGGNSKTVMIANIGPADYNYDETISTLRYANRAKNIRNRARINEDPKDAILLQYQEEIFRLRALLEQKKQEWQKGRSQSQGQNDSNLVTPKKKKTLQSVDEQIGCLLEEQRMMEEKHRQELQALLSPYGINPEGSHKDIMEELERRKSALVKDGEAVKEENQRLLEELQQASDAMINSKRQCKELFHRVMFLELHLQKSQETHNELKSKEKELAEQSMREEHLRKTLELKRLTSKDLKAELTKLQDKIELNQKSLNRINERMATHAERMGRAQQWHTKNVNELQELRRELTKELKLKKLIVDNFIPRKILKKIEARVRFDQVADKYHLAPRDDLTFDRPPVKRMLQAPYLNLTRFTRFPKTSGIFYSDENLVAVEPEAPVPRSQALVFEEEDPAIDNYIKETLRELNQELVIICDHRKGKFK